MQKKPAAHAAHVPPEAAHDNVVMELLAVPALHVHAAAWAPPPAQLKPGSHGRHVPLAPAQLAVVVDVDAYPGLHVHTPGCDAPPAHTAPALQPAGEQVPVVVAHAPDAAVDAYPAEHEHAAACAPFPVHAKPGAHGRQLPLLPAQATVVVAVDA